MHDYQESVTTGQTHRQTPDKFIPMCRYAMRLHNNQYNLAGPSEKGAYGFSDVMQANDVHVDDIIYGLTLGNVKHAVVGWLFLRINVNLAIYQPYPDLEAGDNQSLKIQVARPGIEPQSSCSASQELNHSAIAAPSNMRLKRFSKIP